MWNEAEVDQVIIYKQYCPPTVKQVIACGSSAFIGEVDERTVMKYPLAPGGDMSRLEVEKKLLEIVGPHDHIVRLKGYSDTGLYLERAINGTLAHYLESDNPPPSTLQRVSWCREAAEAVAWVHARGAIHCDIQPTNLLLDDELHIKLVEKDLREANGRA
ncbi:kinase-like domain-containing protein [Aspergillus unguis]